MRSSSVLGLVSETGGHLLDTMHTHPNVAPRDINKVALICCSLEQCGAARWSAYAHEYCATRHHKDASPKYTEGGLSPTRRT